MQDSWRHEALEGTGFLKVVFLFNTYIFCAGTRGKTFQGFGKVLHKIK